MKYSHKQYFWLQNPSKPYSKKYSKYSKYFVFHCIVVFVEGQNIIHVDMFLLFLVKKTNSNLSSCSFTL